MSETPGKMHGSDVAVIALIVFKIFSQETRNKEILLLKLGIITITFDISYKSINEFTIRSINLFFVSWYVTV